MLGDAGKEVVGGYIDRLEQVGGYAPEAAVRGQKRNERTYARHDGHDEEHEHGIAQPPHLGRIGVAPYLLILTRAQAREEVLKDAQRADDGAIDAAKEERKQQ